MQFLEIFLLCAQHIYNHIAQHQGMTTPNILKVSENDQESLKLTGLSMVLATGSLEEIEQRQRAPPRD